MAQRLPTVGSDDGTWGTLLNDFIGKEHDDITPGSTHADSGRHKTVTIKAGTASAGTAPLKFTSGTVLSSPEAGAMEFNNDTLSFTITTGPTRKTVAFADFSNVASQTGNGGKYLTTDGTTLSWATVTSSSTSDYTHSLLLGGM